MHIEWYLQRIGINEVTYADLLTLNTLQHEHTLNIPFENLGVEAYYEKIVIDNRGGFCYELNGLFN